MPLWEFGPEGQNNAIYELVKMEKRIRPTFHILDNSNEICVLFEPTLPTVLC